MRRVVYLGMLLLALAPAFATDAARAEPRVEDRDPIFAPDGKRIAFVRIHYGGSISIMAVNRDGRHLRTLLPNVNASDLAWSPDGSAIAFTSDNASIWRLDLGSGHAIQLTDPAQAGAWQPAWSPDGREIVYDRSASCYRCTAISIMANDGSNQREIVFNNARRPIFSPVTSTLIAQSGASGRVIGEDGSIVIDGPGYDTIWSPRGADIAYTFAGLWVENLATKQARRLTGAVTGEIAWSPDGRRIAGTHGPRVAIVDAKRGSVVAVLRASQSGGRPSWGGNEVAYLHAGRCGIDVASEDGGHAHRVTRTC